MMLVPRAGPAPRRSYGRLLAAGVLALFGHALFGGALLFLSLLEFRGSERPPGPRQATSRPVVLRNVSPVQWAQNRGPQAKVKDTRNTVARRAEKKAEPKTPEVMPKGQIVDVAPGNGEVDPNSKYIAETSNKVKRETRAKDQSAFYRNAMPQRTSPRPVQSEGTDAVDVASVAGNSGRGADDRPLRETPSALAMEVPDVKGRSEVALRTPSTEGPGAKVANRTEASEVKGNSSRLKLTPGVPGAVEQGSDGRAGLPGALTLVPSSSVLDKVAGAAPNDHLRDVDEGDGTFLSTREWKYASFFNRVKQSVSYHWNPQQQLRLRDPTLQIYGGRDRHTVLSVTLSPAGVVRDVFVEKSCGLDFLDLEAIKAFERAQPFPNPPPGLLASDMTVRFQFGFFLEMSGRPGLRLFRSND